MSPSQINKELLSEVPGEIIQAEEYQDRFYFVKLINIIFPGVPRNSITKAIDQCNSEINLPRKRKIYLKRLSEILSRELSNINTCRVN